MRHTGRRTAGAPWSGLQAGLATVDVRCYRFLSREHCEQCLGFLEVGGVKALGEPAVDRREQSVRFHALALLLPQPPQAHGGAQFQRLRLLAAGNGEGVVETGFGLSVLVRRLQEQQFAFEAMQLGFAVTLSTVVRCRQRLGQHTQPLLHLSRSPIPFGQQGQEIRPFLLCPGSPIGRQALAHLRQPLCSLSLPGQRPAPQDRSPRQP